MYVSMYVCMYVCMNVCMLNCIYVCMYVCMNVCMYVYACILFYISHNLAGSLGSVGGRSMVLYAEGPRFKSPVYTKELSVQVMFSTKVERKFTTTF